MGWVVGWVVGIVGSEGGADWEVEEGRAREAAEGGKGGVEGAG